MTDLRDRLESLSRKQLELLALELQGRLDDAERRAHEPVAIVGIGCRFPGGAESPAAFWRLLLEGADAVDRVPPERWDADAAGVDADTPEGAASGWGAFLEDADRFDARLFGIAPREAASMDPQQRLLLEVAWEALERAGKAPYGLAGSRTGVFVGVSSTDFREVGVPVDDDIGPYTASGGALSVAAGRLAYVLGLQGPAIALDTACSSSLVAVHLAVRSLRSGESDLALAGGVNLMLSPTTTIALSKASMLAPDGRCKAFDARADGFVRGEGCGLVVLRRLGDALADGDPIVAVILGSAVNQDGRSNGLSAPTGPAQEAVLRAALADANVAPDEVGYVEAHGTGTALGDPIELHALGAVLAGARSSPLAVGSVKTNVGHLESAAGVAGLVKAALAVRHGEIPPNLHFERASPHIAWDELASVVVPTERLPWPGAGRRVAGVSSFGFSGTNAHVVLAEPPAQPAGAREAPAVERPLHLLALSARDEESLDELAARYAARLRAATEPAGDVCRAANAGRSHLGRRLTVTGATTAELAEALSSGDGVVRGEAGPAPRVGFLLTGQGAGYRGVAGELAATSPVFADALARCDAAVAGLLERPLSEVLCDERAAGDPRLAETDYAQPALFALGYALAELWRSYGVVPSAVLGHSVGEYAAACVAGALPLEDGLRLVVERGRLLQATSAEGRMAVVAADERLAREAIGALADRVAVAAVNAPAAVTLSGDAAALELVLGRLREAGAESRPLDVSRAFHSPLVEPVLDALEAAAAGVAFAPPQVTVVSNLTGEAAGADELASARHWRRHAREPVRFAAGVAALDRLGCTAFVELGPGAGLLALGRECLPDPGRLWLPSLRPGGRPWSALLDSVAALYRAGAEIDWAGADAPYRRPPVELPTYPFRPERYPLPRRAARGDTRRIRDGRAAAEDLLFEPVWRARPRPAPRRPLRELAATLAAEGPGLAEAHGLAGYAELAPRLDALCAGYARRALTELGLDLSAALRDGTAPRSIAASLAIQPRHERLLGRLLEILDEDERGNGARRAGAESGGDLEAALDELRDAFPAFATELELLGRCGAALPAVLRGAQEPLEVLFPGGDLADAERLYGATPSARTYNALVARAVSAELERLGTARPLRVLEVGGGTGGTTTAVLPALDAGPAGYEYTFTDVSPHFVRAAEERFAHGRPGLRFRALDIASDPAAQGLGDERFDVVVAANVVHATPDVRRSLDHLRGLLAPGGLLVLVEGTSRERFGDLTVGLTDGWWAYADDLRSSHALLPRPAWHGLLDEAFADVAAVGGEPADGPLAQQAVLLARAGEAPVAADGGTWVVLADDAGVGDAVAARLREAGARCAVVRRGGDDGLDRDDASPAPGDAEAVERLLAEVGARSPIAGVVHLWPLDAQLGDDAGAAELEAAGLLATGTTLHVVQALVRAGGAVAPRLVVATRGGEPVAGALPEHALLQATVGGLVRVVALEHPELAAVRVDLDPAGDAERSAEALAAELLAAEPEESEVAFRGGLRHVRRLVRAPAPRDQAGGLELRPDAAYLVTGGLGGLGLLVAERLVERGARHLLLCGRREPTADARAAIARLERAGARVTVARVDMADPEAAGALLASAEPAVAGIVHAAGVLDDGVLLEQTWERFRPVLAPKVHGGWSLHRHAGALDFLVLFSSGASVIGSPGQANHAAASAFLDGLAHARRARGLPSLTLNWGAWSGVGAAVATGAAGDARRTIAPEDGLDLFERALADLLRRGADAPAQLAVLPLDAGALRQWAGGTLPRLYAELERAEDARAAAPAPPTTPTLAERLAAVQARARRRVLEDAVRERVASVLALDLAEIPLGRPLSELGLDSLMALELRNALGRDAGRTLQPTLLFTYPTVSALAGHLAAELGIDGDADGDEPEAASDLAGLSEDEVAARLAQKLDALAGGRGA